MTERKTDDLLDRAAEDDRHRHRLWFGLSGEPLTGTDVATYLTTARNLLDREGWNPRPHTDHGDLAEPFGLREALDGNRDLEYVATRILELLIRTHTGAPTADYHQWDSKPARTFTQVRRLLDYAADYATRYGPSERDPAPTAP